MSSSQQAQHPKRVPVYPTHFPWTSSVSVSASASASASDSASKAATTTSQQQQAFLTHTTNPELFDLALQTSYLGFIVDAPTDVFSPSTIAPTPSPTPTPPLDHLLIQTSLQALQKSSLYLIDVTQPFGLGTKCAKTFVTRCLLGDAGTTYRYLGLRMFSHCWDSDDDNSDETEIEMNEERGEGKKDELTLKQAVRNIKRLNTSLSTRTGTHLEALSSQRPSGQQKTGRGVFDVCLINRMTPTTALHNHNKSSGIKGGKEDTLSKAEPTFNSDRTSVSWHADSSLEHYSTIGVYHTIVGDFDSDDGANDGDKKKEGKPWRIALRVYKDAEGPNSTSIKPPTNTSSSDTANDPSDNAPLLSVPLPSGSAYYLLDDFNHHHQHAVLAAEHMMKIRDNNDSNKVGGQYGYGYGSSSASTTRAPVYEEGIRYSTTHRLLRSSHNISDITTHAQSVLSQFHKKGAKLFRSEQLVLAEVEFEWLRQFYVQGAKHKELLWTFWGKHVKALLRCWSALEERTAFVVELLRLGSMEVCGGGSGKGNGKKEGKKRKKALGSVLELVERSSSNGSKREAVLHELYDGFADLVQERAEKRRMWEERERDGVFYTLDMEFRPLSIPLQYNSHLTTRNSATEEEENLNPSGRSPMPFGDYKSLEMLAAKIRVWGKNFVAKKCGSGDYEYVLDANLKLGVVVKVDEKRKVETETETKGEIVGLEVQSPFARMILQGRKTIETRRYTLPVELLNTKIEIIESLTGEAGVSCTNSSEFVGEGDVKKFGMKRIGCVVFTQVVEYKDRRAFEEDEEKHMCNAGNGYGWVDNDEDEDNVVFGWVVGEVKIYERGSEAERRIVGGGFELRRRVRSLFDVVVIKAVIAGEEEKNKVKKSADNGEKRKEKVKGTKRGIELAAGEEGKQNNKKKKRF